MAASTQWSESNLVGEVVTDGISNLNFGSVDDNDIVTTAYPIVQNTNSFGKYIRIKFGGTWTEISNMKFWKSAGAYVTGELIKASGNATYATPSASATGDSTIPTVEGSALTLNSYEDEATIVYGNSGVTGYTDYMRFQLQTTGSTPAGAVNQKTITFQYDET